MNEEGNESREQDDQQATEPRRLRLDIALVIALAPIVAAALRIWLYSGGDSAIFLVLLRTINIPAVLVGTSFLLIPTLLVVGLLALLWDPNARLWTRRLFDRNRILGSVIVPVFGIVILYTTPWTTFVSMGVIGLVALAVFFIRRAREKRLLRNGKTVPRHSTYGVDAITLIFLVVISFAFTQTNMWLPLEKLRIEGEPPEIGYVLESTDHWTTILTPKHTLAVVSTSRVESRRLCKSANVGTIGLAIQGGGLKNGEDCR